MVVFDASPLILLAKAELLERFLVSFSEPVVIPQVVEAECCENKALFDAQLIARLIAEKHIEVRKLSTGVQKFDGILARLRRDCGSGLQSVEFEKAIEVGE